MHTRIRIPLCTHAYTHKRAHTGCYWSVDGLKHPRRVWRSGHGKCGRSWSTDGLSGRGQKYSMRFGRNNSLVIDCLEPKTMLSATLADCWQPVCYSGTQEVEHEEWREDWAVESYACEYCLEKKRRHGRTNLPPHIQMRKDISMFSPPHIFISESYAPSQTMTHCCFACHMRLNAHFIRQP